MVVTGSKASLSCSSTLHYLIYLSQIRFVFPVRVGTPSQTLYVIFDTGSGDFWLWSWQMPASVRNNHRYYNATNSSTATIYPGQTFSVAYASGSAHGNVWQDVVWIDGLDGSIGVTGNPIECAQNVGGALTVLPAIGKQISSYSYLETVNEQWKY